MNGRQFGPCLADYGTRFRLWAPAANRVDVVLEQPHAMKRGEDGWFTADIAGVQAGTRYKFRIDDQIDVPDPASAFQPADVFGPSEVIDHHAYPWRATDWRGRPWQEAVVLEAHVGTFTGRIKFTSRLKPQPIPTPSSPPEPVSDIASIRN